MDREIDELVKPRGEKFDFNGADENDSLFSRISRQELVEQNMSTI